MRMLRPLSKSRFAIRKFPTPPGATLFKGHAATYSPLAKHKFEESNAKALGPIYRFRNYTNHIVVVNDPALQQEVSHHSPLECTLKL